ncbi:hypothetical protein F5X68DRAFT_145904, partial [Plectosphaerella plurivora]
DTLSIAVSDLRALPKRLIESARTLYRELIYRLYPDIDLYRLKDSFTNISDGFLFVINPVNKLSEEY